MRNFTTGAIALIVCGALLAACGAPRYKRGSEQSLVESLLFGVNAKERKMADGIYQLTVADSRDRHEIPPTKMMIFFAAELTREKGYETFVILPSDEKPYQPREVKKIRARVLSGEFNEYMRKAPIKVRTTTSCRNGVCSATYRSRAIVVMLKGDERKKARSFHADKTYKKLKPEIPEQGNVLRRERNRARSVSGQ